MPRLFLCPCGKHHVTRQGYCPDKERRRGSASSRGYDYQHQQLRLLAIRQQPWCSQCGSTEDLTADHIIPRSKGGRNVLSNYKVLCRSCNSSKGGGEGVDRERMLSR